MKHEGILSVKVDSDNEVPDGVFYHRKCRSMFTIKRELNRIVAKTKQNEKASLVEESSRERRASIRSNPSTSRVYEKECIFCGKKDKYKKGIKEGLTQARELRVNDSVRKAAISKQDSRILTILSRDLVAAEGHYHHTCYRHYTNIKESDKGEESEEDDDSDYVKAESSALSRMFDYIRNDLFKNNDIIELSKLSEMLRGWISESGVKEVKLSTTKHIRRKLNDEFGDSLLTIQTESNRVLVYPDSLTREELVLSNYKLQKEVNILKAAHSNITSAKEVAYEIRQSVKNHSNNQDWPPDPSKLDKEHIDTPLLVNTFLQHLLMGDDSALTERMMWLRNSIAQDLEFAITRGRYKPVKHILLAFAVKSLTGNVELIQLLNRLGHGIDYTQLEEIDTSLCLQKLAMAAENCIPLPGNIHPYKRITLAFDNIDRIEGTLSGGGTSHRVNGIAVQPAVCGPHPEKVLPKVDKSKQRSCAVVEEPLPIYNIGQRTGPPPRKVKEVDGNTIIKEARNKNLLFVLARLHYAAHKQKISSWTGFNIKVHDKENIFDNNVGYLPTINAPATSMSTVNEILNRSLSIMHSVNVTSITCVFDQAIYCKALEIKSKNVDIYKQVVLRLGTFHTLCTLLSIIGKRFQDAGLKDLCIESGIVAEGSVSALLEGRSYNRAIRVHKLAHEALMRVAWRGFQPWVDERYPIDMDHIRRALDEVANLGNDLTKDNHDRVIESQPLKCLNERFKEYVHHLRKTNGPLSAFWMSYIEMGE